MAVNLSGLVKDIEQSLSSLGNTFFNKDSNLSEGFHPETTGIKKVLNEIDKSNWSKSLPYVFAVVDGSNKRLDQFGDFPLPINPSDLSQEEIPAIKIKKTQGGTIIQNGGIRYGTLQISGTTGVHPNRGAGGASLKTGNANFAPDTLRTKSGHFVFLQLRNWFKAYYQYKAQQIPGQNQRGDARLIFKNFKDGEFLIIELKKFTMKRSAARKTLYDYVIDCEILGRAAFVKPSPAGGIYGTRDNFDSVMNSAHNAIDSARGVFLRSQDILRQIESTYEQSVVEPMRKAALAVKAFLGIGTVAADLSNRAIRNTVSAAAALGFLTGIKKQQDEAKVSGSVDSRVTGISLPSDLTQAAATQGPNAILNISRSGEGLMAIDSAEFPLAAQTSLAEEQSEALELQRSYFEAAIEELKRVRDNAADHFNLGDATFDAQFNRTVTTQVDPNKTVTDREFELLAGFESAIEGLYFLLSTTALFKSAYSQRISAVRDQFSAGELEFILSEAAVQEVILDKDVDLENLALRYLGNAGRWVEIVELNDLKPPYIIQDQSDTTANVKHPGEKILIPKPLVDGFGNAPVVKDRFINSDLSAIEKNLGIDVKLTSEFDFALGNRGDLEVVRGTDNAAQAIVLKLHLEPGDLEDHPTLGVGTTPGTKVPTVTDIKTRLVQTLTADPRFEKVENLQILNKNSELRIKFDLKLKDVDVPVPVDLKL